MLDHRLKGKEIDVLVVAGKHEGKHGFIILKTIPATTISPIRVKLGPFRTQKSITPNCLVPDVSASDPQNPSGLRSLIWNTYGARVLVIGRDASGDEGYVGSYGCISVCPYELPHNITYVYLFGNPGRLVYFPFTSLCCSTPSGTM